MTKLFEVCVEKGPARCPIYETRLPLIRQRLDRLLTRIKTSPIPFFNTSTEAYGLVDYSIVKFALLQSLVRPYTSGEALLQALADLERGEVESIWRLSGRAVNWKDYFSSEADEPPRSVNYFADGRELGSAVACTDADQVSNDLDFMKAYYEELSRKSSFAYEWTRRISCSYVVELN